MVSSLAPLISPCQTVSTSISAGNLSFNTSPVHVYHEAFMFTLTSTFAMGPSRQTLSMSMSISGRGRGRLCGCVCGLLFYTFASLHHRAYRTRFAFTLLFTLTPIVLMLRVAFALILFKQPYESTSMTLTPLETFTQLSTFDIARRTMFFCVICQLVGMMMVFTMKSGARGCATSQQQCTPTVFHVVKCSPRCLHIVPKLFISYTHM
jgi:hypothetical protein